MEEGKYVTVPMETAYLEEEKSCPMFEPVRLREAGKWCKAKAAIRGGLCSKLLPWVCACVLLFASISYYSEDPHRSSYSLLRQISQWANWTRLMREKASMQKYGAVRDPLEMDRLPLWVVSLQRATERREKIQKQMEAQNIQFTFMDAIDGVKDAVTAEELKLFSGGRADRYRQGVVFDQRKVATDVTNWRLMHRMLAENIPTALIMEDDFILPEGNFMERLNATMAQLPVDWDLFALNGCSLRKHGQSLGDFVGEGVRVLKTGSCTLCVVIKRETAIKVLKAAEHVLPYQNWDSLIMGYMAQTGDLNSYLADPPLCLFNEKMPSIIEPDRKPFTDVLKP